jgi:DNA uptake protein ComE-like DNA-binding protein
VTTRRGGFALLAALWVTVTLSAMALAGLLVARGVTNGSRNRIALMRGQWRAEDCLARARAVIDAALNGRVAGSWATLDRAVATAPAVTDAACDVTLVPAGIAVDLNVVDREQLLAVLRVVGVGEPRADSMADAVLDWRVADGPFADVRELRRARGFEDLPDSLLYAVFTAEPGRIVWARASLAVIASLPGIGEEALARIAERRSRGVAVVDLNALLGDLSPGARALLTSRYSDLTRLTTDQPDAWVCTARGGGYAVEVRLAQAGSRAAIVRRRTTP